MVGVLRPLDDDLGRRLAGEIARRTAAATAATDGRGSSSAGSLLNPSGPGARFRGTVRPLRPELAVGRAHSSGLDCRVFASITGAADLRHETGVRSRHRPRRRFSGIVGRPLTTSGRSVDEGTLHGAARVRRPSAPRQGAGPRRAPGARPPAVLTAPPAKKPGQVDRQPEQTPWGLIAVTAVIVLFAAAIVVAVIATHKSKPAGTTRCSAATRTTYPRTQLRQGHPGRRLQARARSQPRHHAVTYDTTPPVGGNHSPYWADCSGTVYPNADRQRERRPHARTRRGLDHLQPGPAREPRSRR